ncbi:MAG: hypothetical protein Fur0042_16850 [Cyanophyceae cyanobacterium]
MGQQDRLADGSGAGQQEGRSSEEVLQSFTQDLRQLQHELLVQLTRDVERLGVEKARLAIDIDRLRVHRQRLQARQGQVAPRSMDPAVQQWAQQWAKQLASHMGSYLQGTLDRRFDELEQRLFEASQSPAGPPLPSSEALALSENTDRLVASLDGTLQRLFSGLQRDLGSYESDLARRVMRMRSLQQQGDALLDVIAQRFDRQLAGDRGVPELGDGMGRDRVSLPASGGAEIAAGSVSDAPTSIPVGGWSATEPEGIDGTGGIAAPPPGYGGDLVPTAEPEKPSWLLAGLLAVLAAIATGAINAALKLLLKGPEPDLFLGTVTVPGVLAPTLGNVLLVLTLRLAVVTAFFPVVMTWLQPSIWAQLRDFWQRGDREQWLPPIVAGFCLFLSQTALYMALGWLPTGVAIALFFIYPVITLAASGPLFGDRLSPVKLLAMAAIAAGLACVAPLQTLTSGGPILAGTVWAIVAGLTFAGYALLSRIGSDRGSPAASTLISFAAAFGFASLSLIVRPVDIATLEVDPTQWNWLLIACVGLGFAAIGNIALSDRAVRYGSGALAALASAAAPIVTAAVGTLVIQETYGLVQLVGVALVSLGAIFLSLERSFEPEDGSGEDDRPITF